MKVYFIEGKYPPFKINLFYNERLRDYNTDLCANIKLIFLFYFSEDLEDEREQMFLQISEHCLPKLVCELHARLPGTNSFTDSEKSLMALIG